MSAPNYDMSSAWNDQYVPPQLEQEYSLDPSIYDGLNGEGNSSSFLRRPAAAPQTQNASFSATFNPSFGQNMHAYTVAAPQHQPQASPPMSQHQASGAGYLAPPPATSRRPVPQFSPNPMYSGSSPSPHHEQLGMSPNLAGGYGSYQQLPDMRSGPPSGAPSPQHVFDTSDNESVYAPSTLFNAGFPTGQLQMDGGQLQGRQAFNFAPGALGGSAQGILNTSAFKRHRAEETVDFDGDGDADAEDGPATRGEVAKPKA